MKAIGIITKRGRDLNIVVLIDVDFYQVIQLILVILYVIL